VKPWVKVELDENGYSLNFEPSDLPASLIVEVLFAVLEDMKRKFDAAPALTEQDMKAWQMLGRLD
jgi:hypothetical protein